MCRVYLIDNDVLSSFHIMIWMWFCLNMNVMLIVRLILNAPEQGASMTLCCRILWLKTWFFLQSCILYKKKQTCFKNKNKNNFCFQFPLFFNPLSIWSNSYNCCILTACTICHVLVIGHRPGHSYRYTLYLNVTVCHAQVICTLYISKSQSAMSRS